MNVLKSVLILWLYAMKLLCYQPQQNFSIIWRCSDFSKDTKVTLLPAIDETDVSSTSNRWVFWLALKAISVSIRNPQLLKLHTVCKMLTCGRASDNDPNSFYPAAMIHFLSYVQTLWSQMCLKLKRHESRSRVIWDKVWVVDRSERGMCLNMIAMHRINVGTVKNKVDK